MDYAFFWSATQSPIASNAWYRNLAFNSSDVNRTYGLTKSAGLSIRCLKD
jgi:uncharacterized protein (TIGR02145 family)